MASDLQPLKAPPRTDFQYGEWLRERFDARDFDPESPDNPDLVVLLAMVRRSGQPLVGPPPNMVIDQVPAADLRLALTSVVPALLSDLPTDTANVLLTLARVWHSLTTDSFVSKNQAADWAVLRLPERAHEPLRLARSIYLGERGDIWTGALSDAQRTADLIVQKIETEAASRATSAPGFG